MLCEVCDGIFRGDFLDQQWQAHHRNVTDLYQAALNECWLCQQLWKSLIQDYWGHHGHSKDMTREEKNQLLIQHVSIILTLCMPYTTNQPPNIASVHFSLLLIHPLIDSDDA